MTKKIVILGGGTAGWMAACLFANKWPTQKVSIELVEAPDIGIIGVGEGSTPMLKNFFQTLGVDESEWMPRFNATYKLGIQFSGWSPSSGVENYRHPFFSALDTFTQNDFVMNCRNRRHGLNVHVQPDDFFITGVLSQQGKGPQASENFPFEVGHGYHFDSGLLGQYLSELAIARGVVHTQARVTEVKQHENGDIAALMTACEARIDADFFVDCSGFASVLMQQALGVKFESFKDNLFNDSAVVMQTPASDTIPVETVSQAMTSGWCWKIPLTNRVGNGYVYSSDFISPDQAEIEFRALMGTLESDEPARHLKMKVGQLSQHWYKNCLALGLSQGFIEPLEATALHLVQDTIDAFIGNYEKGDFSARCREDFNRYIHERFERVRDYIVAHYKLNTRKDSDYWQENRDNVNLSDSLRHILDVWFRVGGIAAEIDRQNIASHFTAQSWYCLLSGYGAYPELSAQQPDRVDFYTHHGVEKFLQSCALNFDSHRKNLDLMTA